MQNSLLKTAVKFWSRANYSIPAPIQKRDKNSDFSKLNTLETKLLTSQKCPFSSSTLDPATEGNPCSCKGFRVSGETTETKTRQLTVLSNVAKNIERIKKYVRPNRTV